MSVGSRTSQWFIRRGDAEFGPYPPEVIRGWVAQGKIAQDVMLSDGTSWITLAEFLVMPETTAPPPEPYPPPIPGSARPDLDNGASVSAGPGTPPAMETPLPQEPEDDLPVRDRIVMLGRSRSGKTIYLATLYEMLWKRTSGLSAKALTGSVHKELTNVVNALRRGQWPAATVGSTQMELEINHEGRKRLLVTLDIQGEIFAKAFLHDQQQDEEVKPLLKTIDRAAAVLLLVDPAVVAGEDHAAAMEDDFGLVQAVERIYNWPGGQDVPIVFVLTKADQHQRLLDQHGGAIGFVRHYFPALVRTMKQIPIFQVSAVQCTRDSHGQLVPKPDSVRLNVDKPLLYCLNKIDHMEKAQEQQKHDEDLQRELMRLERERDRRERAQTRMLIAAVVAICLIGAVIVGLIIYYKF